MIDFIGANPEPPATAIIEPVLGLSQPTGAIRAVDSSSIADRKFRRCVYSTGAAINPADVKLQHWIAWSIGHRVVAGRLAGEGDRDELTGAEGEAAAGDYAQSDPVDLMGQRGDFADLAFELKKGLPRDFVGPKSGDCSTTHGKGTAGQHQTIGAVALGKGINGMRRELDIAAD
jgi:hypothetical protein